jgi:uncharacterized protein (TIGR03435 family)
MSRWQYFGTLILATLPVFAQTRDGQSKEFDAASVKPAAQVGGVIEPVKESTPGRVTYRNYVLKKLLMEAYQVTRYQVEGPPWIERDMYDIIATKPRGTTADQERQMLQSLLASRFHLVQHRENKEMPGYVLLPGKDTSKLHVVKEEGGDGECNRSGPMARFAEMLATVIDKPVIDQTGIPGRYYFILTWSDRPQIRTESEGAPPPPPPRPSSLGCPGWTGKIPPLASNIFEAVKEQMGLRLERKGTMMVNVMVLDHMEKATAN